MICVDTSSLVALLEGGQGGDVELVGQALKDGDLCIAPITVTEMLSSPDLPLSVQGLIISLPQLEIKPGYWERAGRLRAELLRHHLKPKIADTLIAQSCLDYDVQLVTRDQDFSAFRKFGGLRVQAISNRMP